MTTGGSKIDTGEESYQEREAVAIFDDERSLNAAVDALVQAGFGSEDMSVLGHDQHLAAIAAEKLADQPDVPRAEFVSDSTQIEGRAALSGGPALVAGLGSAWVVGSVGAALIPAIALTAGSVAVAGGVGLLLSRFFGRRHAERIQEQLAGGGLLLWVHAPDAAKDEMILSTLKAHGGRDVHIHVVTRHWGVEDVPLRNFNLDPLIQ